MRGGYDANPKLLPGGRASAFAGLDAAFAVGRSEDNSRIGLTGEFQNTTYSARGIDPSDRVRVALEAENNKLEDWSLRSSTSAENTRSYNLRSFDAAQSARLQWTGSAVRPFLFAEARYTTLNETNAILTDFLPEDQRFFRGTVTPGVTVKLGVAEIGASVAMSAVRHVDEPDYFGFRRNSERAQPYLFYRFDDGTVKFSGSVSRLYANWHDADFTNLRTMLFDADLAFQAKDNPWKFELSAKRAVGETTFPISPVTIAETYGGKLTFNSGANWSAGVLARWQRTGYRDSPFSTNLFAYGLTANYAFSDDWSLGAELLRIESVALNGASADGGLVSLSLARKFVFAEKIKRTAVTPSNAQTGIPLKEPMPAPSASTHGIY